MADKTKAKQEDKNRMKPSWEVTFVAENILVQAFAIYIAQHDGEMPPEDVMHRMTKSCCEASIFFNANKRKYGIHDRITDSIGEDEL